MFSVIVWLYVVFGVAVFLALGVKRVFDLDKQFNMTKSKFFSLAMKNLVICIVGWPFVLLVEYKVI